MSTQLEILTALVEASVGQRDVADGIAPRRLDGRFDHAGWSFAVDWTSKGGAIACTHAPSAQVLRCRAGDLAVLAEFAARCVLPAEFDWPAADRWPDKFAYDHAAGEFVVSPPIDVARVASAPARAKKEWCDAHALSYRGTCPMCERDAM